MTWYSIVKKSAYLEIEQLEEAIIGTLSGILPVNADVRTHEMPNGYQCFVELNRESYHLSHPYKLRYGLFFNAIVKDHVWNFDTVEPSDSIDYYCYLAVNRGLVKRDNPNNEFMVERILDTVEKNELPPPGDLRAYSSIMSFIYSQKHNSLYGAASAVNEFIEQFERFDDGFDEGDEQPQFPPPSPSYIDVDQEDHNLVTANYK